MKRIYLDYAALTPVDPRVTKEMKKYSTLAYGNPSGIHEEGVRASRALAAARARTAKFIHAHADEIIYTASGTEANNLAILGTFSHLVMSRKMGGTGKPPHELHAVILQIEHPSVLEAARHMEELGVKIDYVPIDADGVIDLPAFEKLIRPNTFLVSVMMVNNEIGTVQPVREVAKIIRRARKQNELFHGEDQEHSYPYFHCDVSQAPLYFEIDTLSLGADLLTFDAHKLYGPRGLGFLYKRRGLMLKPLVRGGKQESGLRSGTENLPAIVGLARALDIAEATRDKESVRLAALQEYFLTKTQKIFPNLIRNGASIAPTAVSPHILNLSFPDLDAEFLLLRLDAKGIACATKSSCLRDADESYVLRALRNAQKSSENLHGLRFSFGRGTQKSDIDRVLKTLASFQERSLVQ